MSDEDHEDITVTDSSGEQVDIYELKERGRKKKRAEEYEEAIALLDRAVELAPEYAPAYHELGNCYQLTTRFDPALENYDKSLELDPELGTAYRNRGNAYKKLGEFEKATEDYTEAIERKPNTEYLYSNRGAVYYNLGEYEKARADYTKAIELNPEFPPTYLNRAELHLTRENARDALADAEKALEVSDDQKMVELSLMFVLICKITLGEDADDEMERYRDVCTEKSITRWSFDEIESWLAGAKLSADKEQQIRDVMNVLRERKGESTFL